MRSRETVPHKITAPEGRHRANPNEDRIRAKWPPLGGGTRDWIATLHLDPAYRLSRFTELQKRQPPIVGTPDHWDMLENWARQNRWGEIRSNLEGQARNAISYWERLLGKKRNKGGRPIGSKKETPTSRALDKLIELYPKFKSIFPEVKALLRKYRSNRKRVEDQLVTRGLDRDTAYCLAHSSTPFSAAIAYLSNEKDPTAEALEKAYYRRLRPKSGYGAAYGYSYGSK